MPYQQPDWMKKFAPNPNPLKYQGGSFSANPWDTDPNVSQWDELTNPAYRQAAINRMQSAFQQNKTEQNAGYDALAKQIREATDPAMLNRYFDVSGGNLSRNQGNAVGQAQSTAAAQAASRGMLNPSGFVTGAGSRASAPYAQAFGGLEASRAQALQALAKQAWDMNFTLDRAKQGDKEAEAKLLLMQQQLAWQKEQSEAGWEDYLAAFLPMIGTLVGGPAGAVDGSVAGRATKG